MPSFHEVKVFLNRCGLVMSMSRLIPMAPNVYKLLPTDEWITNPKTWQILFNPSVGSNNSDAISPKGTTKQVNKSVTARLVTNTLVDVWSFREKATDRIIREFPIISIIAMTPDNTLERTTVHKGGKNAIASIESVMFLMVELLTSLVGT